MKLLCVVLAAGGFGTAAAGENAAATAYACQAGLVGEHPAGRDNDTDGVPDSEDWCVSSAGGSRVDANGCAAGEIAVRCAGGPQPLPKPVAVVSVRDSDGDGVADADDRCPRTARGVTVDRTGCAVIEKVVLRGVNFAVGSATLKPAAHDTLRSVAAAMKANKKLSVEIGGHSDSVGDDAKNQKLSERRAESVKAFLVKEGVEANRLTTRGYGESQPADTNDTAEGRANNRRVAFRMTGG